LRRFRRAASGRPTERGKVGSGTGTVEDFVSLASVGDFAEQGPEGIVVGAWRVKGPRGLSEPRIRGTRHAEDSS